MKNKKIALSALMMAVAFSASADVMTNMTFQNGIDGYAGTQDNTLYSAATLTYKNAGDATSIGAKADRKGILQFDLASLPAHASIDSATIRLYQYNATQPAFDLTMYQLADANAGWLEGVGNFANYVTGDSSWRYLRYDPAGNTEWAGGWGVTNAGTDYIAAPLDVVSHPANTADWLEFDIPTALIEQWATGINAGVMLTSPTDGTVLASSEYEKTTEANWVYRPLLTINYSVVPEPATLSLFVMSGLGIFLARRRFSL